MERMVNGISRSDAIDDVDSRQFEPGKVTTKNKFERGIIERALEMTKGHQKRAAELPG